MKIGLTEDILIENYSQPYIIAEIGANHNGDMALAMQMIDAAKKSGADAVKFQSWTTESLIAKEEYENNQSYDDSPKKHFGSLYEMVEKYYLRTDQHKELFDYCENMDISFISSAFSEQEVDILEELGVAFHKVASMDINNLFLLKHIASTKKPVVLSTGMADLKEIELAVKTIENEGNNSIVLLHCVSLYPPCYEDINLNNIKMLREHFGYPVGFSDHTLGYAVSLAAAALGACVIEKHFTTDKYLPGWDHEISADPTEMEILARESKHIAISLGTYERTLSSAEKEKRKKFRRSLVLTRNLKAGDVVRRSDLTAKRPGTGVSPDKSDRIIGKTVKRDMESDELVREEDVI
tara:strand:- start:471 stop:1526 length:1056 start_codon:yes stop_codon:yes gene_type:complete